MGETLDFFRGRLDSMIDLQHPLAVLGTRLAWAQIEAELAPIWQRRSRDGVLQQSLVAELFDLTGGGGRRNALNSRALSCHASGNNAAIRDPSVSSANPTDSTVL